MNRTVPTTAPNDEAYWSRVRAEYDVASDFINLEHGQFSVTAAPVDAALQRYQHQIRREGAYFLRERYSYLLKPVMDALAAFTGASVGELLITRNLTESFNILLQGYPFHSGDEVVLAQHDFHTIVEILEALKDRKNLKLTRVTVPLDPRDDEEIVEIYERAISSRTRVLLLTHLVHSSGQILPVAKIAAMARRYAVDVMVDAAHSFGQLDFNLTGLGADFVGVNLHKWLGAPLGVGLLYVKQNRIAEISPFFNRPNDSSDISKLGKLGTIPPAPILVVGDALSFHQAVGSRNKEDRLRYLTQYWLSRVRELPSVRQLTPLDPSRSCAIAAFSIDGLPSETIVRHLMQRHKIFTVARRIGDSYGVRVTPHLFTTQSQLDLLIAAISEMNSVASADPR